MKISTGRELVLDHDDSDYSMGDDTPTKVDELLNSSEPKVEELLSPQVSEGEVIENNRNGFVLMKNNEPVVYCNDKDVLIEKMWDIARETIFSETEGYQCYTETSQPRNLADIKTLNIYGISRFSVLTYPRLLHTVAIREVAYLAQNSGSSTLKMS